MLSKSWLVCVVVISIVCLSLPCQSEKIVFFSDIDCSGDNVTFAPPDTPEGYFNTGSYNSFKFTLYNNNPQTGTLNYITVNVGLEHKYNITLNFDGSGYFGFTKYDPAIFGTWYIVWAMSPIPIPENQGSVSNCWPVLNDQFDGLFLGGVMSGIRFRSFHTLY